MYIIAIGSICIGHSGIPPLNVNFSVKSRVYLKRNIRKWVYPTDIFLLVGFVFYCFGRTGVMV